VLAGLIGAVRDVRRGGSAAIDLCSVAAGRVDAYYERGPQRWDIAAAGLIAAEAGARVEGLHGEPASPELVIAAAPAVFEPLHELLARLGAASDDQPIADGRAAGSAENAAG
jgi:myo-inositol-1(or 4)-monophosphatase